MVNEIYNVELPFTKEEHEILNQAQKKTKFPATLEEIAEQVTALDKELGKKVYCYLDYITT